jgi:CubicO group peptidase (beta-lactamase class C family)
MRKNQPLLLKLAFLLGLNLMLTPPVLGGDFSDRSVNALADNGLTDADIQAMLRDYIQMDHLGVGLAVGIVDEHGKQVVSFGKLDNGTDAEVDGDTLFEIGSVTKVFTALLLQDMIERGEMKLDDPVRKFLPDSVKMPTYQGKEITLLHLATHTSGLPRDSNGNLYSFLSHCTLDQAPGTHWEYSNLGMCLLGHVIALKAGKDYETLVVERICRPLGMDSTRVSLPPELKARLAIGHVIPASRIRPLLGRSEFPGAGSLRSTVDDLLKFVSAYAGITPSPLSNVMAKAQALHTVESGEQRRLAWEGSGPVFEHGGLTEGFQSELAFDTKRHRGVVVLSNCRPLSTIVPGIWQPLLDGRSPKPTNTWLAQPSLLDGYCGFYLYSKASGGFAVHRDGQRLIAQYLTPSTRYFPFEIFPCSETVFRNEFWGLQAKFLPAPRHGSPKVVLTSLGPYSGIHDSLTITRNSTTVPKAPAPVQPDSKVYDGDVGQYRKTLLFGLVRIGPTLNVSHMQDEIGDHLIASASGHGKEEFFPLTENTFILSPGSSDDLRLTFVQNKKGQTKGVLVYWNGMKISGARISDKPVKQ